MTLNELALGGIIALCTLAGLAALLILAEILWGARVDAAMNSIDGPDPEFVADLRKRAVVVAYHPEITDEQIRAMSREDLEEIYRDRDTPAFVVEQIERVVDDERERRDYEQTARRSR